MSPEPSDATNPAADYLLIDWRRDNQSNNFSDEFWAGGSFQFDSCPPSTLSLNGLAVSRVTGIPVADEFWGHFDHGCSTAGELAELQRATTLGSTGYATSAVNVFRFEYRPTSLVVFVNGVEELNILGEFHDGRLAFYNFSQANVTYSGIEVTPLPNNINIHPTSFPSPVNVCKSGLGASTPVTIWGDGIDVAEIDLTTLRLGGAELKTKGQTPNCIIADVGEPNGSDEAQVSCGDGNPCDGADWLQFELVPDSGSEDLTCHFYTSRIGDDVIIDGSIITLPLTGCFCDVGVSTTDPDTGLRTCNGVSFDDLTNEVTSCGDGTEFAFSDEIKLNKKCLAEVTEP